MTRSRPMRGLAVLIALAACGGHDRTTPGAVVPPRLAPSGPPLPPPPPVDARARGAEYLTAVGTRVQPAWGQFLEDCRLRLPRNHPLNQPDLMMVAELAIAPEGRVDVRIVTGSGNGDFDTAAVGVIEDASPMPSPPAELASDDEHIHLRWLFARDGRQAGPATAQVIDVQLPLLRVVEGMLARNALPRALRRLSAAPASDPERMVAIERVMIAVLRDDLASSNGAVRRAAVEAVGRIAAANRLAHDLAPQVHRLVLPTAGDLDLRIAAIGTSGLLGDPAAAPALVADLREDLASRPRLGVAKVHALAVLRRPRDAAPAIRAELEAGASAGALAALFFAPDPQLVPKLDRWAASGDARVRAAVCTALPDAAPAVAAKLIARGMRDPAATVRASCTDALARGHAQAPIEGATLRRLYELTRDRDQRVRAHAIAATRLLEPSRRVRAVDDPAPEVRAASALGASESELRTLAADRDADVRAAAIAALGDRARDLAARAMDDDAPQVRMAALDALADPDVLATLVTDASPEVATAALVKLAAQRGREAVTPRFLATLAAAPASSLERVRYALAWLLAR